jgi:hypothetical protein
LILYIWLKEKLLNLMIEETFALEFQFNLKRNLLGQFFIYSWNLLSYHRCFGFIFLDWYLTIANVFWFINTFINLFHWLLDLIISRSWQSCFRSRGLFITIFKLCLKFYYSILILFIKLLKFILLLLLFWYFIHLFLKFLLKLLDNIIKFRYLLIFFLNFLSKSFSIRFILASSFVQTSVISLIHWILSEWSFLNHFFNLISIFFIKQFLRL